MDIQEAADRVACTSLISSYAYFADAAMFEQMVELFAEDGVLTGLGNKVVGHQEILAFFQGLPREPGPMRHLCAVPAFLTVSESEITAVTALNIYQGSEVEGGSAIFVAIAEYEDKFVKTPQGWKIATRHGKYVMMGEPAK